MMPIGKGYKSNIVGLRYEISITKPVSVLVSRTIFQQEILMVASKVMGCG
jgi:hypothetical protein